MSRPRDLKRHIEQLGDIRDIVTAMKNIAYMETRKLARFLDRQQQVVANIEAAARDFLGSHSFPRASAEGARAYVLMGSERGFCGDFNETLETLFRSLVREGAENPPLAIAIGRKLALRIGNDERVRAFLDGPNVVEEVPGVLNRLVEIINDVEARHGPLTLAVVHHATDARRPALKQLLPPFADVGGPAPGFAYPVEVNLDPPLLLAELVEHYLFAVLHELFYTSLMAENHRRIQHLESAVRHLDEQAAELMRRYHSLRREEITEEIEVILLNAEQGTDPASE